MMDAEDAEGPGVAVDAHGDAAGHAAFPQNGRELEAGLGGEIVVDDRVRGLQRVASHQGGIGGADHRAAQRFRPPGLRTHDQLIAFRVGMFEHGAAVRAENGDDRFGRLLHEHAGQRASEGVAAQLGDGFLLAGLGTDVLVGAGELGRAAFHAAFQFQAGVLQLAPGVEPPSDVVAEREQVDLVVGVDERGVDLHGHRPAVGVAELDLQVAQLAERLAERQFHGEAFAVRRGDPLRWGASTDLVERLVTGEMDVLGVGVDHAAPGIGDDVTRTGGLDE